MKIKYYKKLKDEKILTDIRELLVICDAEFVPPLSNRGSTTQTKLAGVSEKSGIDAYFQEIATQSAIVALEDGHVIAFMSFKSNYICEYIKTVPNQYITTVLVRPGYRQRGLAGKLYAQMMKQFSKQSLFTRTWSTNVSHIRILLSLGFHEHCHLDNDRGKDIDTIYYRLDPQRTTLSQYIKQYHLGGNIFFSILLFIFTMGFLLFWVFAKGAVYQELFLAISTSLMASLLCLISDTFLKIRDSKNDAYINRLKSYGVENLQFNKNELLESIIPSCRKEIWISGCRLIMTSKASFRAAMVTACKRSRNLHIKILVTPPWSKAYQLTYGVEDVSLNYMKILKDLIDCTERHGLTLEMHFSEKPLFSDTYKVDERFITGPYLHCTDKYNHRITAKDFFSLDITSPETELYKIIESDYMTLWNEAVEQLDVALLTKELAEIEDLAALSDAERTAVLRKCCMPL